MRGGWYLRHLRGIIAVLPSTTVVCVTLCITDSVCLSCDPATLYRTPREQRHHTVIQFSPRFQLYIYLLLILLIV